MVIVAGEGGVGKSRLALELGERAERRGWGVTYGRAFPVEAGVPYALFSDAFMPILTGHGSRRAHGAEPRRGKRSFAISSRPWVMVRLLQTSDPIRTSSAHVSCGTSRSS